MKNRTSYESQTGTPRTKKRGARKNLKPASGAYHLLGIFSGWFPRGCSELLSRVWRSVGHRLRMKRGSHSLRVCEVASLGEKRFVAVVQYGRGRFLVGGAAGSVSLLSRLGREDSPTAPPHASQPARQRRLPVAPAKPEERSEVAFLPLLPNTTDSAPYRVKSAEAAL
jgi:flagellar biogenesis protein FliO